MINLDKRLTAVLNEIKPCKILVDIGSDHGKVVVLARQKNLCEYAIATDISENSIKKASDLIAKVNIDRIETRVGNGTSVLKENEFDTVVIAGMGGYEIINILSKSAVKFKKYILVPHKNADMLRLFLAKENLYPEKDYKIFCKNKFYDIIVSSLGNYNPTFSQLYFGNCERTEDFNNFATLELIKLESLLKKAKTHQLTEIKNRLKILEDIINESY